MSRFEDILDIAGVERPSAPKPTVDPMKGRPWLSVYWKCCRAYSRVYRNPQGTHYHGRCPRCGTSATASVGQGGTNNRFFTAE